MTTTAPAPVRRYADGQPVTFYEDVSPRRSSRDDRRPRTEIVKVRGVVESALLSGIRHPGWIYTVRRTDNGRTVNLASGLVDPA